MTIREYQELARRTQNPALCPEYKLEHATWGLAAEVGEVVGLLQKMRQGHELKLDDMRKEIGDCGWMLGELCDCFGFDMEEVFAENIEKLRRRYPNGFEAERSVHREV